MSAALEATHTPARAEQTLEQQLDDARHEFALAQYIDNTREYERERERWAVRISDLTRQIEARDAH